MKAMVLEAPGRKLREAEVAAPGPGAGARADPRRACGVCRTDLHIRDGELPDPKLPLVLGHQIVEPCSTATATFAPVPASASHGSPGRDGDCRYCRSGRENLCDRALFTGYTLDGGFAEEAVADARYCLPLPGGPSREELAPLLCAGLIGYRALRTAGEGERLGLYGFGAAAHIVAQLA